LFSAFRKTGRTGGSVGRSDSRELPGGIRMGLLPGSPLPVDGGFACLGKTRAAEALRSGPSPGGCQSSTGWQRSFPGRSCACLRGRYRMCQSRSASSPGAGRFHDCDGRYRSVPLGGCRDSTGRWRTILSHPVRAGGGIPATANTDPATPILREIGLPWKSWSTSAKTISKTTPCGPCQRRNQTT